MISTQPVGKRKTVVCYICGREFGTKSIDIHEPQCLAKWRIENDRLPRGSRRPLPQKIQRDSLTQDQYNELAEQSFKTQLMPCPVCARRFLPDRLEVHRRSCGKDSKHRSSGDSNLQQGSAVKAPAALKPRTIICHICGREFGTKSIDIHEPQCLAKWRIENDRLPRGSRRPLPQKIQRDSLTRDQYNELAEQSFKTQLMPCPVCARRFLPERLEVHRRSCGKDSRHRSSGDSNLQPGSAVKAPAALKPRTVICHICGREYGTQSISIHEPQCLEKWRRENEQLPIEMRRNEPRRPDGKPAGSSGGYSLAGYNESAWEASKYNLAECRKCGRKFKPDRLAVHERVCKNI